MNPKVIVYSTPKCPYCVYAKEFFTQHNVPFVDKNVAIDREAAKEMVQKTGQMGVPVIDIGGTMLVGYQPQAFKELLSL